MEAKILTDFKRKGIVELKKLEADLEMYLKAFLNSLDIQFSQFPHQIQNMTLSDIIQEINTSEDEDSSQDSPAFKQRPRRTTRATAVSDDGYNTDKTHSRHLSTKKSVASFKSAKKNKSTIYAHTPKNVKPTRIEPVTPKISINAPVNVLRKPRDGETVISMSGSPLMVSSVLQQEQMANLFVPLNNGDVISLLPTGELRPSMIPAISPGTRDQLKALKRHIEKFIS